MPSKPPKCKLCGVEHWNSEPHVFGKETAPAPKQRPVSVTTPVTKPVTPVTTPVTTRPSVTTPVTQGEECVCPTCGAAHLPRVYASQAEKQRAYRARRSGHG